MTVTKNKDRILLNDFIEVICEKDIYLYKSEFSLEPLINTVSKTLKSSCELTHSTFTTLIKQYESLVNLPLDKFKDTPEFRSFIKLLIPGMRLSGKVSYITKPFGSVPIFITDTLDQLLQNKQMYLNNKFSEEEFTKSSKIKTRTYLLKNYFGLSALTTKLFRLHFTEDVTGLSKYFQIRINNDYVEARFNGKKPILDPDEINNLAENMLDDELWNYYFPYEELTFHGFSSYDWEDVTEIETKNNLTLFADVAIYETSQEFILSELNRLTKDYFHNHLIAIGIAHINTNNVVLDDRFTFSKSGILEKEFAKNIMNTNFSGVFAKILLEKKTINLHALNPKSKFAYESALVKRGYKCAVFAPVFNSEGNLEQVLEFLCKDHIFFDHQMMDKVDQMKALFESANEKFIATYKNRLAAIIQEEYTAIHPSVQWRFELAANDKLFHSDKISISNLDSIVFNDLTPLYAQSDIVGSSRIRNDAIKVDLLKNLKAIVKLLENWSSKLSLYILDDYFIKIKKAIKKIQEDFSSGDESVLTHLITDEIHPYLENIASRFNLIDKNYNKYQKLLDPKLGIVYEKRKDFEESVTLLTSAISDYIENEDNRMQKVLPHYFEKYRTDGVEYNLYIGDSLLKEDTVNKFDIKEFRIWQLINMCEVVKLVDNLSDELPVTLKTAQLIFVYNSTLNIRFRTDEKKFDVDGTYNVRYEILKKRLDKATIKGSQERLTVENKIAIVYLSETDKKEYFTYLEYLISKNLITNDIEELELEKMQGIQGLQALRVTVAKNSGGNK